MTAGEFTDSGNSGRPPYRYVEGDVRMSTILEAAGLSVDTYNTPEYLADRGVWALMEIFSDGELRILAGDDAANQKSLQQTPGEVRYGEFYSKIASLRASALQEGGPMADEVNKLARFCGRLLAVYVERGQFPLPDAGLARPGVSPADGRAIVDFKGYRWHSPRDTAVILEYGPGIAGTKFIDAQLNGLQLGLPYQYIGVSDGPFVNQFLTSYLGDVLTLVFGPAAGQQIAASGTMFIGREDGMKQATEALLATPQPGGTHEVGDLILMNGVYGAEPEELEYTLRASPRLLRHTGRLMLSSPLERLHSGMTPFPDQLGWAKKAGYEVEWRHILNTGDQALGTDTVSGLAVLRK